MTYIPCSSCVCTFACVYVWMCGNLLNVFEIPPQAVYCWVLPCLVLQCVAVWCSVMQCDAVWCGVMRCDAVWCSVMRCVAVCCSVMRCDWLVCVSVRVCMQEYARVCLSACAYYVCVCECVCERESERERERAQRATHSSPIRSIFILFVWFFKL